MAVAIAAIAALGQHDALAGPGDIGNQGVVVLLEQLGAERHLDDEIRRVGAGALGALAMAAALGAKMLLEAKIDQGVELRRAQRHHRAATPAIAAVRPAARLVALAPEADAAVPAGAARHIDFGLIQKAHENSLPGSLSYITK